MRWYYVTPGLEKLPIEETDLSGLASDGVIRPQTLIWTEGLPTWQAAGALKPELFSRPSSAAVGLGQGTADATVSRSVLEPLIRQRGWLWVASGTLLLWCCSIGRNVWLQQKAPFAEKLGGVLSIVGLIGLAALLMNWAYQLSEARYGGFDVVRRAARTGGRVLTYLGLVSIVVLCLVAVLFVAWLWTFVGK